ncbi:tripartite tricarboxylate transporter TctB family protein [Rhodospirillaceae bacterium SYSU D60015]|uniref:tripartite tricarboxylate transporter TctB family protein n=1 Tax=Desertibaculum subflavum TaxID=2268458 RepID=UPI000E662E8E
MRLNDAVIGLVLIVVGLLVIWHTRSFPAMPGQKYGPDLFPSLIAAGLAFGGVILVASGLRARAPFVQMGAWARSPLLLLNFLSVPAALLFYILCSDALGFLLAAPLVLAVLIALYRRGRVVSSVAIAIVAALLIQQAFSRLLLVPLPRGVIENLIG